MHSGIRDAVQAGTMTTGEASAARELARAVGSAVRVLGRPGDPLAAVASGFLSSLVQDQLPPTALLPDPSGTDQSAAETARLARQNESFDDAAFLLANSPDPGQDAKLAALNAELGIGPGWPISSQRSATDPADSGSAFAPAPLRIEIVGQRMPYAERVADAVGGELAALYRQGVGLMSGGLELLEIDALKNVQGSIRRYLEVRADRGLGQAETIVLGSLYAANEALFPTSALDLIGGKSLAAIGALARLGGAAEDIARLARVELRAEIALKDWTLREAKYVTAGGSWVRKPPGTQDAAVQLETSLERAGLPRPSVDSAPHHIVGFGRQDAPAQKILTDLGITPNEVANGVWIPRDVHGPTFSNTYKDWVGVQLQGAGTADGARAILQNIRDTVQQGATPWKAGG